MVLAESFLMLSNSGNFDPCRNVVLVLVIFHHCNTRAKISYSNVFLSSYVHKYIFKKC